MQPAAEQLAGKKACPEEPEEQALPEPAFSMAFGALQAPLDGEEPDSEPSAAQEAHEAPEVAPCAYPTSPTAPPGPPMSAKAAQARNLTLSIDTQLLSPVTPQQPLDSDSPPSAILPTRPADELDVGPSPTTLAPPPPTSFGSWASGGPKDTAESPPSRALRLQLGGLSPTSAVRYEAPTLPLSLIENSPGTTRRSLVYTPTASSTKSFLTITSVATPLRTPTSAANMSPSRILAMMSPRTPWSAARSSNAGRSPLASAGSPTRSPIRRRSSRCGRRSSAGQRAMEWRQLYLEEVGRLPANANQFRAFVLNRGGELPYCVARRALLRA